ncbi:MAG: META domain-containing protein [Betaproteobacteria bacterium]
MSAVLAGDVRRLAINLRRGAFLAASLLAASACAGPAAPDAPFPVGTTLAWLGTDAAGARRSAPADVTRYTVSFDPSGRAAIRLDCNRGSAQWRRDGDALALTPIASTKMMCPRGSLDATFAADLAQVARWRFDGAVLTLTGRDGSTMQFRPSGS